MKANELNAIAKFGKEKCILAFRLVKQGRSRSALRTELFPAGTTWHEVRNAVRAGYELTK